jgi:hypothetical protein
MTAEEEFRQLKRRQIEMKREGAERARRLAIAFWSDADRNNALVFAAELDAQANELERALAMPPQATTQTQVRVQ